MYTNNFEIGSASFMLLHLTEQNENSLEGLKCIQKKKKEKKTLKKQLLFHVSMK
jgi:hypothetical protein